MPGGRTEEEAVRAALVACGMRLDARGLVAGSSGNLSARLDDGTILATPTGRALRSLAPGDLIACHASGEPLPDVGRPTSELPLHLAAYRTRPDIRFVVHAHPTYCVAWSKIGRLFPLDTVGAMESLGPIGWTPYAPSGSERLAALCAEAFGRGIDTVVMERHGLSSVASDLDTAYARTDLAEQTARIEFAASLLRAAKGRTMPSERPVFPHDDLRSGSEHPEYHSALDAFASEYAAERPDRTKLHEHAERARGFPSVAEPFERWWHDPRTQGFLADLNAAGL